MARLIFSAFWGAVIVCRLCLAGLASYRGHVAWLGVVSFAMTVVMVSVAPQARSRTSVMGLSVAGAIRGPSTPVLRTYARDEECTCAGLQEFALTLGMTGFALALGLTTGPRVGAPDLAAGEFGGEVDEHRAQRIEQAV